MKKILRFTSMAAGFAALLLVALSVFGQNQESYFVTEESKAQSKPDDEMVDAETKEKPQCRNRIWNSRAAWRHSRPHLICFLI